VSVSPSSSSSEYSNDLVGKPVPTLEEIIGRLVRRLCECNGLLGKDKGSSPPEGGDEPARTLSRLPRPPNAEWCKSWSAVLPKALRGNDEGGDSKPNREGTDAAIGPPLWAIETPLLSKEFGSGASKTLRPF
jgi:hypothetical protein